MKSNQKKMLMKASKKQQLIEQLRVIRFGGDNAKRVVVTATSGEIEIKNTQIINNILDFLLKELRTEIAKELEE